MGTAYDGTKLKSRGKIAVIERLQIYYPLTGKNAFEMGKKHSVFSDFSGILIFFVTLLSLAYGYEAFFRENYLKLLVSRYKSKQVRFSLLVSRLIVLFLLLLVFFAGALLLIWINGLSAQPDIHILALLLKLFLAAVFFFVLGMVFSTFKSKIIGIIAPVIIWFILLFVIPPIISTIVAETAGHITPVQKLELQKFKIFMDCKLGVKLGVRYFMHKPYP